MITILEDKLEIITRNSIFFLVIVGIAGLLIRIYYFPFGIPITLDGLDYFWYALDMSQLGKFPTEYTFPNNGWPSFLSIFFSLLHSNNFLDYMVIQRSLTIFISVFTIIPVYLLCKRFFDKSFALIGAAFFAFDPRLIQNSLLGITEPLFILLGTISLFLFLSENSKVVYFSFGVAALFALVRYEGLLLVLSLSIMFFARFRKEEKVIPRYLLAIGIFVLVLLPMTYVRIETIGRDGLVSNVAAGPQYYQHVLQESDNSQSKILHFITTGMINFVKYLGWAMIPIFILFVPIGIIMIFKNSDYKKTTIILTFIILLLPALYAYSRDLHDSRYLYILFPIFCLLSIYTIQKLENKFGRLGIISILLVTGILVTSITFLNFKGFDYEHEREAFSIAQQVTRIAKVVNEYYPEGKYLAVAKLADSNFPVLRTSISNVLVLPVGDYANLEDYIKYGRNEGLTHLVLDGAKRNPIFLNSAFLNGEKYPYLIKVYDSSEHGYRYHVKIYRIDYDKFDLTIHSK